MDDTYLAKCQEIIGYEFSNLDLLRQALTHSSAAPTRADSNERMEFLGDAVMGLVICEEIYTTNPDLAEGDMTKIKSAVVSRQTCAGISDRTGMTDLLVLGKGVRSSRDMPGSLRAAVLEAVIGAVYLDGGFEVARTFILKVMRPDLDQATGCRHQRNYKSLLQQYSQRELNITPQYDVLDEKGPEHSKCFEVAARLGNRVFTGAWANSKKEAEQKAALSALQELGVLGKEEPPPEFEPDDPAAGQEA